MLGATASRESRIASRVYHVQTVRHSSLYSGLFFILCATYSFLPIERGFPTFSPVSGVPLTITIIVSTLMFLVLLIASNGRILKSALGGYVVPQIAFVSSMALAAILSPNSKGAMFIILNYFVTFILNFYIVVYLFRNMNRGVLVGIVSAVASVVAVIGLLEVAFGYYLPFYSDWFKGFAYAEMTFAMAQHGSSLRVLGTLGNAILHGSLLALAVPFALGLNGWLKWAGAGLLAIAILLSTSLTGTVIVAFCCCGAFLRRDLRSRVVIAVVVLVLLGSPALLEVNGARPWERALYGDQTTIGGRVQLLELATSKVLTPGDGYQALFGNGLRTSSELFQTTGGAYGSTLENVWLTIGYEWGLLSLFLYLLMEVSVLYQLRFAAGTPQWWAVLGFCTAGGSFVTIYYASVNFLWVCLIAWMAVDKPGRVSLVRRSRLPLL